MKIEMKLKLLSLIKRFTGLEEKKKQQKRDTNKLREIEKIIAKVMLVSLIVIMLYPLIFWSGTKRLIGILIDLGIIFALYKACFKDIPTVHIGMLVSPFWGRIPEYLPEGKHIVLPWDKVELELLKVKIHSVKEERGYLTLDGAPINLTADIFYKIAKDNIYLYKEIEGAEGDAIEGKVKEYLYGMIGSLETDEVIARQGELAKGVLEEIRLHPISSKERLLVNYLKKLKLLEGQLMIAESKTKKDEDLINGIKSKINKIKVDIETLQEEIKELYGKETRKMKQELEETSNTIKDYKEIEKAKKEIEEIKLLEKEKEKDETKLQKKIKERIEKLEESALSELESQFAIRISGSRIYGFDIADEEAKKGRTKRTTAKFERAAIITEWGTTDMIMRMLKDKYPDLSDSELLEAVLVNRGRIEKKKQVIEVEGLKDTLTEIAKVIFTKK